MSETEVVGSVTKNGNGSGNGHGHVENNSVESVAREVEKLNEDDAVDEGEDKKRKKKRKVSFYVIERFRYSFIFNVFFYYFVSE